MQISVPLGWNTTFIIILEILFLFSIFHLWCFCFSSGFEYYLFLLFLLFFLFLFYVSLSLFLSISLFLSSFSSIHTQITFLVKVLARSFFLKFSLFRYGTCCISASLCQLVYPSGTFSQNHSMIFLFFIFFIYAIMFYIMSDIFL